MRPCALQTNSNTLCIGKVSRLCEFKEAIRSRILVRLFLETSVDCGKLVTCCKAAQNGLVPRSDWHGISMDMPAERPSQFALFFGRIFGIGLNIILCLNCLARFWEAVRCNIAPCYAHSIWHISTTYCSVDGSQRLTVLEGVWYVPHPHFFETISPSSALPSTCKQ